MMGISEFSRVRAFFIAAVMVLCGYSGAEDSHTYYCGKRVVGYYPYYRNVLGTLQYHNLTNVIYFALSPNADGSLYEDYIDSAELTALSAAAHSKGVEVSICVGGWGMGDYFGVMATSPTARANFAANLIDFCADYNLDGVDLDWEPVLTDTDRDNYSFLVEELDAAFEAYDLLLTVAVASYGGELRAWAFDNVDWLNVMAYDMGYPHSEFEESIGALEHWEDMGMERERLMLGVPFYGRKPNGDAYTYSYIMDTYSPEPDVDLVNTIYFNGIDTIKQKTTYVVENGYGGIMIWEVGQDTTDETSLLKAIGDAMLYALEPDFNCDGQFDLLDFAHFAGCWMDGECDSLNAWCSSADKDQSSEVDITDLAEFVERWLE
jgi:chitinase